MKKKQAATATASPPPTDYLGLLRSIKERIRAAQVRATLAANAELIHLAATPDRATSRRAARGPSGPAWGKRQARPASLGAATGDRSRSESGPRSPLWITGGSNHLGPAWQP